MRFMELRYFLSVIDAGSFSKAAHSLRVQVSTLSRAVSRLEDELGVTLVERMPTGIRITGAGRSAARRIRSILNETRILSETISQSITGENGEISLGFYLPPVNRALGNLLFEWRKTYPSISITPHEPGGDMLLSALVNCQIDAALIPDYLLRLYDTSTPLYAEPLMAALPSGHRLAGRRSLRWHELEQEDLLLWSWAKDGVGQDFFSGRLRNVNLRIFNIDNLTLLSFVRAGFGVTITAQTYSAMNFPGLTFIPIDETDAHIEINLVWRRESEDPVLGKFVAFMRDRVQRHI